MNNYIYEYYQKIIDGSIVVGNYIRLWYAYIIKGLESKSFYFSAKRANRAILFIENFCHHHEGELAPQLLKLELWEKAMLSVIFGIMDEEGKRQFREALIVIARKNGKTLLAAAIAEYMTVADGEYGARAYFCAPKLDQARLCYEAFYQMIQKEPEIAEMAKKRRTDVYFESSNSSAMPIAFSAKKSDGLNPSLAVCDEVAAWIGDAGIKQYEVLKSAMGARKEPLLLSITTANYINDGIYDELMKRATAVIQGTSRETRFAPFLYMVDDVDKWNDINELQKSNPNLGVSVTVDYLLEEIAIAEQSISKKSEFICKYCNVKQNSSCAWFSAQDIKKMLGAEFKLEDFAECYCLCGIDLSQTVDLSACCILVERDGIIYIFAQFFMPKEKLGEATARDGVAYGAMVERGFLTLSGDAIVDYRDCYEWFKNIIYTYKLYPLVTGYDRYSATYLVQTMKEAGFVMESVFQGYNLTGIIDNLEGLVKSEKIKFANDNDLLKLHFLDAALQVESGVSAHPRKKLVKINQRAHVDGVAAVLDALCMRNNYWTQYGNQLMNAR